MDDITFHTVCIGFENNKLDCVMSAAVFSAKVASPPATIATGQVLRLISSAACLAALQDYDDEGYVDLDGQETAQGQLECSRRLPFLLLKLQFGLITKYSRTCGQNFNALA